MSNLPSETNLPDVCSRCGEYSELCQCVPHCHDPSYARERKTQAAAESSHGSNLTSGTGLDHEWPGKGCTNREALCDELRDVLRLAERVGITPKGKDKGEKFARMMELSRALGRLEQAVRDA